ncbi:hypothetical protein HAX54_038535, partial [Datura stramonium]|nr:hypothetical protein [Datura stramonium]
MQQQHQLQLQGEDKTEFSPVTTKRNRNKKGDKKQQVNNSNASVAKESKGTLSSSMIKAIFWNIRGIRSQKANHRLRDLIRIHKVVFVAILEPFMNMSKIDKYMKYFGFNANIANLN